MKKENDFQAKLVKEIKERFPGAIVLKNDPTYIQGIPDLTILYKNKWAMLECKRSSNEPYRPNQQYYLGKAKEMKSYSATIYPENKEEVLDALQRSFCPRRNARVSRSK